MIVLGNEGCGKTSLVSSLSKGFESHTSMKATGKFATRMQQLLLFNESRVISGSNSSNQNSTVRLNTVSGHMATLDIVESNDLTQKGRLCDDFNDDETVDPLADIYLLCFDIARPESLQDIIKVRDVQLNTLTRVSGLKLHKWQCQLCLLA